MKLSIDVNLKKILISIFLVVSVFKRYFLASSENFAYLFAVVLVVVVILSVKDKRYYIPVLISYGMAVSFLGIMNLSTSIIDMRKYGRFDIIGSLLGLLLCVLACVSALWIFMNMCYPFFKDNSSIKKFLTKSFYVPAIVKFAELLIFLTLTIHCHNYILYVVRGVVNLISLAIVYFLMSEWVINDLNVPIGAKNTTVQANSFCGNCGQLLKDNDVFCPNCGTKCRK